MEVVRAYKQLGIQGDGIYHAVFRESGPPTNSVIELGVTDCCWYNLGEDYVVVNQGTGEIQTQKKDFCKYSGNSYLILKRQDTPDDPVVNISANERVWYNLGGKYKVVRTNSKTVDSNSNELIKFNADTCLLLKKQSAPEKDVHILTANDKGWFILGVGKYVVYEESTGVLRENLQEYVKYEADTCIIMRRQNSPAEPVVTINADEYAWYNLGGNYVAAKMDGTTTDLFSGADFIKCDPSTYVLLRRNADLDASRTPQPHQKNLADVGSDSQAITPTNGNVGDIGATAGPHSKAGLMDAVGVAEVFTDWRIQLVARLPRSLGESDGALINNLMHGNPFDVNINRVVDSILEKATLEIDGQPARKMVGEITQAYNLVHSPPSAEFLAKPVLRYQNLTSRIARGETAIEKLKQLQLSAKVMVQGQVAKNRDHVTSKYPESELFEIQLIIQDIKFASLDLLRESLERKVAELKEELKLAPLPDQRSEFDELLKGIKDLPKQPQKTIIEHFLPGASEARNVNQEVNSSNRVSAVPNMPQLPAGDADMELLVLISSNYIIQDENDQQVSPGFLAAALREYRATSNKTHEGKFREWLLHQKSWTCRSRKVE